MQWKPHSAQHADQVNTFPFSLAGVNAERSSRFAFRACDPKPLVLVALLPQNLSVTTGLAFVSLLVSLALIFLAREKNRC